MPGLVTESFSLNIMLLKICHLYPAENPDNFFKFRAYVMHVLLGLPLPVLGILYLFLADELDMDRVNYNSGILVQTVCIVARVQPFLMNGQRMRECIDFFENFSNMITQDNHRISTEDCIKVCRRNTSIFFLCVMVSSCTWVTTPIILWQGKNLPMDIWLPFAPIENDFIYVCIYTLLVGGTFYCTFTVTATDPLIAGLAYQATNQIKILKDNLENLSKYASKKGRFNHTTEQDFIHRNIKQCVDHHGEILRFVKEFQYCFSPVVFSQFSGSAFTICFLCLQISKLESLSYTFVQLLMYLLSTLGQLYFYCYFGSELSEESDTITHAIYMSDWYKYDTRCKKELMILMERSRKPNVITAGKILDMSLETFAMILRRSYSLIAVLQNYQ